MISEEILMMGRVESKMKYVSICEGLQGFAEPVNVQKENLVFEGISGQVKGSQSWGTRHDVKREI
jgi:hypothetical protein